MNASREVKIEVVQCASLARVDVDGGADGSVGGGEIAIIVQQQK